MELDPDLLRRTWETADWDDSAAVIRRILPQFAAALSDGRVAELRICAAGHAIARGDGDQRPAEEAAAVHEFLHAWWAHTLADPDPAVPAHSVFAVCTESTETLTPWLNTWDTTRHSVADGHLTTAFTEWEYDLRGDRFPWSSWGEQDAMCAELTTWIVDRGAPASVPTGLLPRCSTTYGCSG